MDYGSAHIKPFGVAVDPLTVGSRWRKWKRSFEYFVAARGIANNAQNKVMLMDLSREEVQDIFDVLPEETEGDNVYVKAMAALDRYFEPKTNVPYERSVFRRTEVNEGETITSYVTRLRRLAVTCEFEETENVIRDQVIEKCHSNRLRMKLLEKGSTLTLANVIAMSQTEEAVLRQTSDIEANVGHGAKREGEPVNRVSGPSGVRYKTQTKDSRACYRCKSTKHLASARKCPARERRCNECGRKGHFNGSKYCDKSNKSTTQAAIVDSLDFTNNAQEADVDALFTISSEFSADEGDNYYDLHA
ncbi:uncharacterized protein [Watersipora subatra]|uniref:uncharacterized protein n=1 Tax=Watersipora subatra TaxID=2589382 RepID=UPI00355C20F0